MLIPKPAPVAQGIERSPPKPPADRWQATARAQNLASHPSNKTARPCANWGGFARTSLWILDRY